NAPRSGRSAACAMLAGVRFLRRAGFLLILAVSPIGAHVLRVQVASRQDVLNGQTFGTAGAYERITGRVYFSVSATNPHNRRIVDLQNAVNLNNGEVEFSADFIVVRPKDPNKSNGSMLLEVPNRGHERIVSLMDGGSADLAKDAGDAWLL